MAGKAHAMVSGDPELLSLGERFICPVLTLDEFLDALARHSPAPDSA